MKKIFLIACLIGLVSSSALAQVKSKAVDYEFGGTALKGYLVWNTMLKNPRPGVLIMPEFWGLNDYAKMRAVQLAKLGYVTFAADLYGDGRVTTHPEDAKAMAEE